MKHLRPVLLALVLTPACGTPRMRAQAGVLAESAARLERETGEFAAARTAVVQLRQRNLVERRALTAELAAANARQIHFWKIASDPERLKRLALFDGVVAGATAAGAAQERPLEWEESILARAHALTIDRAALHRFVLHLVTLSRPPRLRDEARFLIEYGAVVGAQVQSSLAEVQGSASAAGAAAGPAASPPATPGEPGGGPIGGPTDLGTREPPPPTEPGPNDRASQPPPRDPRDPGRSAAPP